MMLSEFGAGQEALNEFPLCGGPACIDNITGLVSFGQPTKFSVLFNHRPNKQSPSLNRWHSIV
ncbi:MAG: hypothetical protein EBV64_03285 [Oxalobacteraceae bacterium]|jgi:hypothetical protein|nr:hypothetical protein [Oxalobacteraceae bacterium]